MIGLKIIFLGKTTTISKPTYNCEESRSRRMSENSSPHVKRLVAIIHWRCSDLVQKAISAGDDEVLMVIAQKLPELADVMSSDSEGACSLIVGLFLPYILIESYHSLLCRIFWCTLKKLSWYKLLQTHFAPFYPICPRIKSIRRLFHWFENSMKVISSCFTSWLQSS